MKKKEASEHAKALSSLGASKGGKARSESLTPEERKEIASKAAKARWGEKLPRATHSGELKIGNVVIPCAVLEDGTRVITQRGFAAAMGGSKPSSITRRGAGNLPAIMNAGNLKPYIDEDLEVTAKPIGFATEAGSRGLGINATVIPKLCKVWLRADKDGKLKQSQKKFAAQAELLIHGFAEVGIIALVDEATGFQHDRARNALEQILEAFIKDNLGKWAKRFSDDFYTEIFRLRGVDWPRTKNPPSYVGHLTNDIVYGRLAPGILKELKEKSPKTPRGNRKNKLHQWLTDDVGHPKLQEHITAVKALMRSCDDWDDFYKRLNRAFPAFKELPLWDLAEKKDSERSIIVVEAEKKLEKK